jgi:hypothetical protein
MKLLNKSRIGRSVILSNGKELMFLGKKKDNFYPVLNKFDGLLVIC